LAEDARTTIWNRACDRYLAGSELRPGDEALRDALALRSVLENGGLAHALEVLGAAETRNAAAGFSYLGLRDVADVIRRAVEVVGDAVLAADDHEREKLFRELPDAVDDRLEALQADYDGLVPDDDVLEEALRSHHAEHPDDFGPIAG